MLEGLSGFQVLLLLIGAAAAGFYVGRMNLGQSHDQARHKRLAQEAATQDFARLSPATQGEVDRFVAAGETIDAIKLIRAALNTGLYEAKQIVDLRKSREA